MFEETDDEIECDNCGDTFDKDEDVNGEHLCGGCQYSLGEQEKWSDYYASVL